LPFFKCHQTNTANRRDIRFHVPLGRYRYATLQSFTKQLNRNLGWDICHSFLHEVQVVGKNRTGSCKTNTL
jgi:hypothetical protein